MRPVPSLKTLFALFASLMATSSSATNVIHTEKSLYRNIVIYEEGDQRCMSFSPVSYTHLDVYKRQQQRGH